MRVSVEFLETSAAVAAKQLPTRMFEAAPRDIWKVPVTPLALTPQSQPTEWAMTHGGLVRVPLLPYVVTANNDKEMLAGFLQLACQAISGFPATVKVHWLVGDIVPAGDKFQLWIGVAILENYRE